MAVVSNTKTLCLPTHIRMTQQSSGYNSKQTRKSENSVSRIGMVEEWKWRKPCRCLDVKTFVTSLKYAQR
jgi:hypothetical protein